MPKVKASNKIKDEIKKAMIDKHLRQNDLAAELGITHATFSKWINNPEKYITIEYLELIGKALNKPWKELL